MDSTFHHASDDRYSKNILFVLGGAEQGGLENHVFDLTERVADAGFKVTLIADGIFKPQVPDNVRFVAIPMSGWRFQPSTLIKLYRHIKKIQPSLIHAQGGKATQIVALLKPLLSCPSIATIHALKPCKWYYQRLDAYVCVSAGVQQSAKPNFPRVIYNGLEVNSIQVRDNGINKQPGEPLSILAVGRLVAVKGFDLLIPAISGLNISLTILGDGPELASLQSLTQHLGLESKVSFVGHVDNVEPYYLSSDLVVISSRKEGFSYVCAEALLHRVAVLSTDVPVANECLPPTAIAASINCDAIRERLIKIIENPQEYYDSLHESFAFARKEFDVTNMVNKTCELYEELLSQENCGSHRGKDEANY